MSAPNPVYAYLDYRVFLRDRFEVEKARKAAFSYRYVARRVGVQSPGHLKRIITGERSLTGEMAKRYADLFGLRGAEQSYFLRLVRFNDSKGNEERDAAYQDLRRVRSFRKFHRLDAHQEAFCSNWYIPAIRELVSCREFSAEPEWIAKQLRPTITPKQAADAVATLLELGMLARDSEGALHLSESTVTTGSQTQWVHARRYHQTMIAMGSNAIDEVPQSERDISSLTLAVSTDNAAQIRQRIAEFRRELLSDFGDPEEADGVVQLNFQLFPLSRTAEETSATSEPPRTSKETGS